MTLHIPEITSDMDTLTAALAYAAAGWYLLPVKAGTKDPGSIVKKGWPSLSSQDPDVIVSWFAATDYGIALHCGRSGAVVLDVDAPDNVPDEVLLVMEGDGPHQSTREGQPGRGHYLLANTTGRRIGNSLGRLATKPNWGEIRGANGVIIVAPTQHPHGGLYRWERTGPLPALPDYLAEALPESSTAEDTATPAQVQAFLDAHTRATDAEKLNGLRRALLNKIESGGSRHDAAVSVTAGALKEARAGYYSAATALETLKPIFINAVQLGDNRRTPGRAEEEWRGIVAWAVAQANAADLDVVRARAEAKMPSRVEEVAAPQDVPPISLDSARATFRKWFGGCYDTDALDVIAAAVAVERFTDGSDPVWLLIVGGPGAAKTETVHALSGVGAIVTSAISSEAALLSATPRKERSKAATGGLLRKVGDRGLLVVKDVTSILSMNRDLRARVLAALREVYDGSWYREVGTDGGLTIPWRGRIVVVGAVTTAWDAAHSAVASMGDRFVLLRLDSTQGRQSAGRQAIRNTGSEKVMRAELAAAVAGVIAGMSPDPITVTEVEEDVLLAAADLVTLARTGVEYDYRGDVIDAHAPEQPTRFTKQLTQIVRGAVAVGMSRQQALRLAIRCARDSMPPLRLAIIDDLAAHPRSSTAQVRKRIDKPRNTVDRQLQALHILGVVSVEEDEYSANGRTQWFYSLADGIRPDALNPQSVPEMSVHTPSPHRRGGERQSDEQPPGIGTDISGTLQRPEDGAR